MVTTVEDIFGSKKTEAPIFVYKNRNGSKWYCQEGATIVNLTFDDVENGVNIDFLEDCDCFTWSEPIKSEEQMMEAVEY